MKFHKFNLKEEKYMESKTLELKSKNPPKQTRKKDIRIENKIWHWTGVFLNGEVSS